MSRRSLKASTTGIAKAKKALERKNLTQQAICNELGIASWATVNKFFNGKGINRGNFQEICQALDLDWQEIIAKEDNEPDTDSPDINQDIADLQKAITHNSRLTRSALDPYILPLIRRETTLEKRLKQIRIGVIESKRRIVPILGAAGYGKSTILGLIYDQLSQELSELNTGWIALARCDDFIDNVENFPVELGEKVSGKRESIVEIAQQLTKQYQRGVLLIDTLDIILTKPLVPVLRRLFSQLLETETTIVFTCRDTDYSNFFEPYHESFAGFRESVQDGCKIPPFDETEVKQAAREFFRITQENSTPESQNAFADKIIALSADSVSLQEITRNPLLLALLCDLFAESENVPEDLTVSQLYERYWNWKIIKVRQNTQSQYLGLAKESLCLKLAETLYQNSQERLRDFVYESSIFQNETEYSAYKALKSDGVFKDLGGNRISFFHQTFLEYAIARWLNSTESGELAKLAIKNEVLTVNSINSRYYLWSIFRQLLTLVVLSEFYQLAEELDKNQLLPFRSLAFAAVSRRELESSSILPSLLAIALTKDYAFQETLLSAANSAPRRHSNPVWQVVITLLTHVGKELINRATEIAAELLSRLDSPKNKQFEQALIAIQNRPPTSATNYTEELHHVWGKFITHYYNQTLKSRTDLLETDILLILQNYYFYFGSNVRGLVIELYLNSNISENIKQEFFTLILTQPPSESFKEKKPATELLFSLLPNWISSGTCPLGNSFWATLHAPLDKRWMEVTADAVGRVAALNPDLLATIIEHLFIHTNQEVIPEFYRSNFMALTAAIYYSGSNSVISWLLKIPGEQISKNRISTLVLVFRALAEVNELNQVINADLQIALVQWVTPLINQSPIEIIQAIDALAIKSPPIQPLFGKLLAEFLPVAPPKIVGGILRKLKFVPDELQIYLEANAQSKEVRSALLRLYYNRATQGYSPALSLLTQLCLDDSRDLALEASGLLLNLVEQKKLIPESELLPILAHSPVTGVRQNALKVFIEIINSGKISDSEILQVFQICSQDTAPEVVHQLYKLVETSIWNPALGQRKIDLPLAQAIFTLTQRVIEQNDRSMIDTITKSAFIAFNQMTLLEQEELMPEITACSRTLLKVTDINRKVDKLVITGLLSKLAKFNEELLTEIVQEDLLQMPIANQGAVLFAIFHDQGKYCNLVEEILLDNRFCDEIKSRIIRERGA
ncbi:hypothetical protein NIES2119_22320 [[Phormidium ambiguum] IAM M-71]|uniref:HTH cro/C1-type domain-containing protein n=1 Tax=[Phormidium ambiguum] IAM M-71 TaxID=454136 RepID=A0A1U7IB33_9CYAN|nr:NACHT domain-containing protein [Phormidium ambiguum]OKH33841.1 hypothetical protein NIES2119_22320 [Phormidium ambiguum IAM M-71]